MRTPSVPATDYVGQPAERAGSFWRGALVGGLPLALLVVIAGAALLLSRLAQTLAASGGFFAQQQAALIVLVAGAVFAAIGYFAAIVWVWRWLRRQSLAGALAPSWGALAALALTALLLLLPLALAVALPPSPAP